MALEKKTGISDTRKEKGLSMEDEDFYVLKFPHKLWKIVHECITGAIRWGVYGKTILIDYNLFQAQYLECEVPKFKTRNMTSFVRQLNMYGFKKMQTQVKTDSSRCCNIHEFFHNCFRYGRYDLLENVKRRPTPVKNTRITQNPGYQNQSRLQMCRAAFAKALEKSKARLLLGGEGFLGQSGEGTTNTGPFEYNFQVIPVENSLKDVMAERSNESLTIEVSSDYHQYVDMSPESANSVTESENSSTESCLYEGRELEFLSTEAEENYLSSPGEENEYFAAGDSDSLIRGNHSVRVKKGFDGTNYVIDLMVGCPGQSHLENVNTEVYETEECREEGDESQEREIRGSKCMILVKPSTQDEQSQSDWQRSETTEDFYTSITESLLEL